MPSALEAALAKHRAELDAGERAASDRVVNAYGRAWADASKALDRLLAKMQAATDAGETITPAWLYQEQRLEAVLRVLEAALRQHWPEASVEVMAAQDAAIQAAEAHAHELVDIGTPGSITGTFESPPALATADLVGFASDGSPLSDLLGQLPGQAGQALKQALVNGLTQGLGPRDIARKARAATGMELQRALTITRTEINRAYRESTRRALDANPGVVAGWTWLCACDRRSCAVCWAMHGREFPTSETLDGHPNCRCSMVPLTKTWESLGFPDVPETRTQELDTGPKRFGRLSDDDKRAILGPGKADFMQQNGVILSDLVDRIDNPQWGTMRRERSLTELRALKERGELHRGLERRAGPGRVERPDVKPGDLHTPEPAVPELPAWRREFADVRAKLPDDPAEWGQQFERPTPEMLAQHEARLAALHEHRRQLLANPVMQADPKRLERSLADADKAIATTEEDIRGRVTHNLDLALEHEAAVRDVGEVIEREALERASGPLAELEAERGPLEADLERAVAKSTEAGYELQPLDLERRDLRNELFSVQRRADLEANRVGAELLDRYPDMPLAERLALRDADPRVAVLEREAGNLKGRLDELEVRYREVRDRADAIRHESNEARRALAELEGRAVAIRRDSLLEVLGEIRPMGPAEGITGNDVWNLVGKVPGAVRTALNRAADFYPREWIARSTGWGGLQPAKVRRGFYKGSRRGFDTKIRLSEGNRSKVPDDPDMLSVAAHELGHRAEDVNPGIQAMEHALIQRRGPQAGERLTTIYGRERGYKDEFVEHYMGKVYGAGGPDQFYEVVSMAMEGIFTGSYDVWSDLEVRRFMLGLLASA